MGSAIIAPSGVCGYIAVRRSGNIHWLEIDGHVIGLTTRSLVDVEIDPTERPSVRVTLVAKKVHVMNNESVDEPGGAGDGEVDLEEEEEAAEDRVRLSESEGLPDS